MSSIFKFTGAQSPPRRLLIQPSPTSPFCTSPSQLQEVTLDPDSTTFTYMGIRSPGASTGRSVKDYEEQMTNLRKENFNLKLRIYFLEERLGANFNADKENAIKKNIELSVEVEALRKEVEEKQELLCQAVKAMELEEEEHKKDVTVRDKEIQALKEELQILKEELQNVKQNAQVALQTSDLTGNQLTLYAAHLQLDNSKASDILHDLHNQIKELEKQLKRERNRGDHLERLLAAADCESTKSKDLELELRKKENKILGLEEELKESNYKICTLESQFQELDDQLSMIKSELENKTKDLKKKEQELNVKNNQMEELKRALLDAEGQMDMEQRKAEKYRSSLSKRNSILSEKDLYIERLETKIRHLESCLNEVNQQSSEMSLKSQMRNSKSNNNDVDSFSVHCPSPSTEFPTAKNASQLSSPFALQKELSDSQIMSISPYRESELQLSASVGENFKQFSQSSAVSINDKSHLLDKLQENLEKSNDEIFRLKRDQFKAIRIIKSMLVTRKENTDEIEQLKEVIAEKDKTVADLKEKIAKLESSIAQLEKPLLLDKKKSLHQKVSELNLTATVSPITNYENSMAETAEGQQLCEQYKALSIELEKQVQVLLETLKEKDAQLESLKAEYNNNLSDLKAKQNQIIDLEFELLSNENAKETLEKLDASAEKETSFWKKELMEKDKEISRLEIELRKRTVDLQTIVNKELWEKNREIEKLQKRYGNILETKEQQILELRRDIDGKESQLSILKDKINELGIQVNLSSDILPVRDRYKSLTLDENKPIDERLKICLDERKCLIQYIEDLKLQLKNAPERDDSKDLQQLKAELNNLQTELEKSEKLRHESQDVCTVLSTRLEELCQFLDSLLKQKSILGFLGSKQKSRLRKIIDQSLDLSRTLSMSISLNPNQSLLQLSNLSNLLELTHDNDNVNESVNNEEESSLSILSDEISLTYQSHLKFSKSDHIISSNLVAQQAEVIKVLREQVENLKKEIELRDIEMGNKLTAKEQSQQMALKNDDEFVDAVMDLQSSLSESPKNVLSPNKILSELFTKKASEKSVLNTTSTTLKNVNTENQSESECWSEPDRAVSMQRMGITDDKLRPSLSSVCTRRNRFSNTVCLSTESTEDEQNTTFNRSSSKKSFQENRQTIVSLHEQVCELQDQLKDKENQLLAAQIAYFEGEKSLKLERAKIEEFAKREKELISSLEEAEKKLIKAEEKEKEANKKVLEYQNMVATLEDFRINMEKQMNMKDKEMQNRINELEKEKEKALNAVKEGQKVADKAKEDIKAAECKIRDLQEELKTIESKTRKVVEEEYNVKLRNFENGFQNQLKHIEEKYRTKVEDVKFECESHISLIKESINTIKATCAGDYFEKTELGTQIPEIEVILQELSCIKKAIKVTHMKMKEMEDNEMKYKQKMHRMEMQYEDKIKSVYEKLDNVSLQHSETLLEKTKLINEKTVLEQEVQKYREREGELVKQVNEFQKEFSDIKHNFQKQLIYLENLKYSLENKVAQLESSNSDLRKKLIRGHHSDYVSSYSLPNSPNKLVDLYPNKTLPISSKRSESYYRQLSESARSSEDISSRSAFQFLQLQAPSIADLEQETHRGNCSPDLGIESDQGRFSSLEANVNIPRPLLPTLELTESMNNLLDCDTAAIHDAMCNNEDCLKKIKEMLNENSELRKKLLRTRRALEETVTQLTLANKRKKEVEKTICRQIHKTSQVLRKAKANLDSGSETEIVKK